jgi:hypothetical protein
MVRYGGPSTPTFVFLDSGGIVRGYLPYRLTEQRLGQKWTSSCLDRHCSWWRLE